MGLAEVWMQAGEDGPIKFFFPTLLTEALGRAGGTAHHQGTVPDFPGSKFF
jgi:hypothetical protein